MQQALAHPWIKGHAQLPDKPLSSIMLTRLKQFTQMSKLKCAHSVAVQGVLRCLAHMRRMRTARISLPSSCDASEPGVHLRAEGAELESALKCTAAVQATC